jgi:hypothetical protein
MQVDDDSYVHVNTLMTVMARVPQRRLFMGHIDRESGGPHREPSSQWYVTKEEWPTEKYPYWAHGAGYVLSKVRHEGLVMKNPSSFQPPAGGIPQSLQGFCQWHHILFSN